MERHYTQVRNHQCSFGLMALEPARLAQTRRQSFQAWQLLIIPLSRPELLVVSHGLNSNAGQAATNPKTARAIVKVLPMLPLRPEMGTTMPWMNGMYALYSATKSVLYSMGKQVKNIS
jgi:hypothetical protein